MKSKLPAFVTIVILTTITAVFWLLFDVYRHFKKEPPLVVQPQVLEPLKQFDINKLNELENRQYVQLP